MEVFKTERKNKTITLPEAASLVEDGMKLGVGGVTSNNASSAFMRELIRRGVKELTIIPTNNTGYQVDILIGAGCVKKLYMSYVGLDYIGLAPNFRRLAESGKLDVVDLCELGLLRALRAGGIGTAFFPLPDGILVLDNVKLNPDWYKVIDDPFTGKKVVVVPPLRCDIAVFHVAKCDAYGNAREVGMMNAEHLFQAADKVIITTEEIVPLMDTMANYKEVTMPGDFVDAVVEIPYGSHPGECHGGGYTFDEEHLREYINAGKDEASFKKYLDEYVYQPKNHEEYLEKIGTARLLKLRKNKYY